MKTVKIGGREYSLTTKNKDWGDETNHYGMSFHSKRQIMIVEDAPDYTETLLHEAIHVIDAQHHLELKENVVEVLASHIVEFLRDNKINISGEDGK